MQQPGQSIEKDVQERALSAATHLNRWASE